MILPSLNNTPVSTYPLNDYSDPLKRNDSKVESKKEITKKITNNIYEISSGALINSRRMNYDLFSKCYSKNKDENRGESISTNSYHNIRSRFKSIISINSRKFSIETKKNSSQERNNPKTFVNLTHIMKSKPEKYKRKQQVSLS